MISAQSENGEHDASDPSQVEQVAARFGMPFVDLEHHEVDLELLRQFPVRIFFVNEFCLCTAMGIVSQWPLLIRSIWKHCRT